MSVRQSARRHRHKPAKPSPSFPVTPHNNGQRRRKIRGKLYFLGVRDDPDAALERYLCVATDLHADREPRSSTLSADAVTVKQLCNHYVTCQHHGGRVLCGDQDRLSVFSGQGHRRPVRQECRLRVRHRRRRGRQGGRPASLARHGEERRGHQRLRQHRAHGRAGQVAGARVLLIPRESDERHRAIQTGGRAYVPNPSLGPTDPCCGAAGLGSRNAPWACRAPRRHARLHGRTSNSFSPPVDSSHSCGPQPAGMVGERGISCNSTSAGQVARNRKAPF